MKVLCYVRPWNKKEYLALLNVAFNNPEIICISDFRGVGDIWIGEYIYQSKYQLLGKLSENEMEDVFFRCRFLRNLDKEKANKLIARCYNGMEKLFKEEKYDLVFAPIIDEYTLDILNRVAHQEKVCWISIVGSFIKGYLRMTERGELIATKQNISEEEIEKVLSFLLDEQYKPDFQLNKEKGRRKLYHFYFRRKLVDRLFDAIKIVKRDFNNYHYCTKSWYNKAKLSNFIGKSVERIYIKSSDLELTSLTVYLPLHYNPEATVDYWSEYFEDVYYEERIIRLVKESDKDIIFVIKEHPAMYGKRNVNFYRKLLSFKNVVIIHPYERSNEILKKVSTVIVHTGSVGVEALLRAKRVITLTKNYYSEIHPNIVYADSIQKNILKSTLKKYDNKIFIEDLLKGHNIGDMKFLNLKCINENKEEIEKIGKNIHEFYDRSFKKAKKNGD